MFDETETARPRRRVADFMFSETVSSQWVSSKACIYSLGKSVYQFALLGGTSRIARRYGRLHDAVLDKGNAKPNDLR